MGKANRSDDDKKTSDKKGLLAVRDADGRLREEELDPAKLAAPVGDVEMMATHLHAVVRMALHDVDAVAEDPALTHEERLGVTKAVEGAREAVKRAYWATLDGEARKRRCALLSEWLWGHAEADS